MFGSSRLDYIVDSEKTEVLKQIEVLEKELEILKSKVNR